MLECGTRGCRTARKHVRGGSAKEYAATTVLRIALDEYAVKQRQGGPLDDADDMAHAVWTGELPFILTIPSQADPSFWSPFSSSRWNIKTRP